MTDSPRLDEKGMLHIPLALLAICLVSAALGIIGLLAHWKDLTATQFRIDECLGRKTIELRGVLKRIYDINDEIRVTRESIRTAADPILRASLLTTLETQVAAQDVVIHSWSEAKALWVMRRGCGFRDLPVAFPALHFKRELPDDVGQGPVYWDPLESTTLKFRLDHPPRKAATAIQGDAYGESNWTIKWINPETVSGAGIN